MTLAEAIANYIEQRKTAKLESLEKMRQKVIDKGDEAAIAAANTEYRSAALSIEESFEPEIWLTNAAKRAKKISFRVGEKCAVLRRYRPSWQAWLPGRNRLGPSTSCNPTISQSLMTLAIRSRSRRPSVPRARWIL